MLFSVHDQETAAPSHISVIGSFSWTRGSTPGEIFFKDQSTGAIHWSWDFGDGGQGYDQNPTHFYFQDKNYTVTLVVTDAGGETATASALVSSDLPSGSSPSSDSYLLVIIIGAVVMAYVWMMKKR